MVLVVVVLLPQKIKKFEYHLKTIGYDPTLKIFSFLVLKTVFQSHILVKCHHQESDNHQSVADNLEAAQLLLQTDLVLGMA